MKTYDPGWTTYATYVPALRGLKGIYHLHFGSFCGSPATLACWITMSPMSPALTLTKSLIRFKNSANGSPTSRRRSSCGTMLGLSYLYTHLTQAAVAPFLH